MTSLSASSPSVSRLQSQRNSLLVTYPISLFKRNTNSTPTTCVDSQIIVNKSLAADVDENQGLMKTAKPPALARVSRKASSSKKKTKSCDCKTSAHYPDLIKNTK